MPPGVRQRARRRRGAAAGVAVEFPAGHRAKVEQDAARIATFLDGAVGPGWRDGDEAVTPGEFCFPLSSDAAVTRVLQFRDAAEAYLLRGVRRAGGFLCGAPGTGSSWIGPAARRVEADVAAGGPGGPAAELVRGVCLHHRWMARVAGMSRRDSHPHVDTNFGIAAVAAIGLCAAAGPAPTRTAFLMAHTECALALELCKYASSWANGDAVAVRWAELANRAAAAGTITLDEALTLESFLVCRCWAVCGLAGKHLGRSRFVAGRAVAVLGGEPHTVEHANLAIALTVVLDFDQRSRTDPVSPKCFNLRCTFGTK